MEQFFYRKESRKTTIDQKVFNIMVSYLKLLGLFWWQHVGVCIPSGTKSGTPIRRTAQQPGVMKNTQFER